MTIYYDTVTENTDVLNTNPSKQDFVNTVTESPSITQSISLFQDLYYEVTESSVFSKVVTPEASFLNTILENISALDRIRLLLKASLSENISLTDTQSGVIQRIEYLLDSIVTTSSTSDLTTLFSSISELLNIYNSIDKTFTSEISETLLLSDAIDVISNYLNTIISEIVLSSTEEGVRLFFVTLQEVINKEGSVTSTSSFLEALQEGFVISVGDTLDRKNYLAYLFSPETMSVVNYDNYNFDGCARFNGKHLFYNSSGLFVRGGHLDNDYPVEAYFTTKAYDFGTSDLKSVPLAYLGVTSDDVVYLKVRIDGRRESVYKLNKRTENLQTQKFPLSKGLGRYFQFELLTNANTFDLESIEFYPLVIKRKL
jgi:hypothetical protein